MSEPLSESTARFEEFRARVLSDPALLKKMRETENVREFIATCVTSARELGFQLTAHEIENALHQARRDWLERWPQ